MSINNKPHTFSIGPAQNEGLGEVYVDRCILYVDGDSVTIKLDVEEIDNEVKFIIRDTTMNKINRFMYNYRKLT
tara:strand:- start:173 stop:394 length:222 start_codon:yes stop_codon:yes gene_type:complete